MKKNSDPRHLSGALSELIALKGLARVRGETQLAAVWSEAAGPEIAAGTQVRGIRRGVLQIDVANAALMGELAGFHKQSLLSTLQEQHADLRIRDLKFRLRGKTIG